MSLSSDLIVYNDNATNHIRSPAMMDAAVKIAPQPKMDREHLVFAYDPYTDSMWMVGRSGQLFREWKEISLADYRAYWAEKNFGEGKK